ncbi:MAG: glycosyltransferase family 9 protein [Pseudomonadota bacterium]|uniref:glycosyltransferase family 9 protein n=1 Tax=Sulfuricystis thermophila TaxID=2496847 RepID=UPI001036924B|nr:glycosyltransferase family 9 protein [Sulfuricystis thermophila]
MQFAPLKGLFYLWLKWQRNRDKRPRPLEELGTPAIRRILAISCTALGDSLLSTPALRALRLTYPEAHITWAIHPSLLGLFEGFPDVNELFPYNNKWAQFLTAVRRLKGYDLAVILHGNEPQATPLAYLSGARHIFKLPNTNSWSFLLSNPTPKYRWEDLGHGIDQRLAVVRLAGAKEPFDRRMVVPPHQDGEQLAEEWLKKVGLLSAPIIALQPGASTTSRRWPKARFIEAALQLLQSRPDLRFIVTGSPKERPLCEEITATINESSLGNSRLAWASAGELPLHALPTLLKKAKVLVTGDTGPMHLAVAIGTPVVALFAVSDPSRSGPAYDLDRHLIIRKWRTCNPCLSKRCTYPEPICMANITVDEVVSAVSQILERSACKKE